MAEIAPRIMYTPEGILEFRRSVDEQELELFDQHREVLDSIPGYELDEAGQDKILRVEVAKVVKTGKELAFHNPSADALIANTKPFTYFDFDDKRDGVLSLGYWSESGATGHIYPQFQRWLNTDSISETLARNSINAMASVLGKEAVKRAKNDFKYQVGPNFVAAGDGGFSFSVVSRSEDFGITLYDEQSDPPINKSGKVTWNWLDLSTIGDCACWGVSGDDRERIYISPNTNELYEMGPHNIDFGTQSLSLVLGIGALAYEAAQYNGNEDILANAIWHTPSE